MVFKKKPAKKAVVERPGKKRLVEVSEPTKRIKNLDRKMEWNNKLIELLDKHIESKKTYKESPLRVVAKSRKNFIDWFGKSHNEATVLFPGSSSKFIALARGIKDRVKESSYRKFLAEIGELPTPDVEAITQDLRDANDILSYVKEIDEKGLMERSTIPFINWADQPHQIFERIEGEIIGPSHGLDKKTVGVKIEEAVDKVNELGLPKRMDKKVKAMLIKKFLSDEIGKTRHVDTHSLLSRKKVEVQLGISKAKTGDHLSDFWINHFEKKAREAYDEAILNIAKREE